MFPEAAFSSHKCDLALTANKEIPVVYFHDTSYNGKKSITAWGTNGILYTFEVVPRKPIPVTMPLKQTKVYMDTKTDEDFTEPLGALYK
jgi:hypothetical protein